MTSLCLYVYELSVQSSYAQNIELPATEESFDTVQWWTGNDISWRIRTFDIDSDIHVHSIQKHLDIGMIESLMNKRYSSILVGRYDFQAISVSDNQIVIDKMKSGSLEIDKERRFAFWNHDNRVYRTITSPQNG